MEIPRPSVGGLGMTSECVEQWEEEVIRQGESPLLPFAMKMTYHSE
jgi:hypothetical protein